VPRFERELRDHTHKRRVLEDFESALQSGVNGTPTFFVNGVRHDDEQTFDSLLAALEDARLSEGRRTTKLINPARHRSQRGYTNRLDELERLVADLGPTVVDSKRDDRGPPISTISVTPLLRSSRLNEAFAIAFGTV